MFFPEQPKHLGFTIIPPGGRFPYGLIELTRPIFQISLDLTLASRGTLNYKET